ncbi:acyl-CoA desaturase [Crocinitomicaceae bacterium CZZ-1]|uniref:Acyl-CoA desaturase n=1 Tax=Taishania pollutisoli TaxID=2766479 RepID=A0A8J6TRP1_9FLAO|nr:acyl-CoA desaturase [Taishania pollutisoli]MBC9811272.1 acyl-CoA desaturase [Taishania pollutisoli]MBX2947813.1 acyl-CoA desaturase [Crocinitomicaceae bacterium]NGF75055.1 acyl-CoA desaturase [Fluviicola sp. SGL-29]
MNIRSIKFSQDHNVEFYKELKKRVNTYFKTNQLSKFGNTNMVVKTIFMVALYIVPYVLILTIAEQAWFALLLWAVAGFGMAGIGLSVMHDANHGSYSKYGFINKSLGYLANMVGGSDLNWRIQHNVLHHTYTNVDGMDEDIDVDGLMRFSPNQKRLKAHRYQHVYAWFLYGLLTINWFFRKDYQQISRYKKMGLLATQNISFRRALSIIVFTKLLYAFLMIALPIWVAPSAWYISLIGFFLMQFIAGFVLSVIFQSAHVVPSSNFPTPNESGDIHADWAVNQLYNTANFAPKARILSWYVGGLNFQVEHHLFPNICHVHYKDISKIVKQTAIEYNLPYYSYATFFGAIKDHTKLLKNLGKYDNAPGIHH